MPAPQKKTITASKPGSSATKPRIKPDTYISLFSSAGIGCYGFKEEKFECVATVELLERRLKIQSYNKKCRYKSGYIAGDLTTAPAKRRVFREIDLWKKNFGISDLDVLIATPPCQGMSVANHKKKDELNRNSLVVESIKLTKEIKPKFFVFENVKAFLTSVCTDIDGTNKSIKQSIEENLAGDYNIHSQILNFKDYGCPSSRTRTLVIGVRKDLKEITPLDLFPDMQQEVTLRQTIGHLPLLKKMGEITPGDIYHSFRNYSPHMEAWIADLKEGESAFDNADTSKIPHTVRDGIIVYNARKNGDKYTRQRWDAVAPCVHTRNDILASQSTVHPVDNRVFSIRELMLMMSVPANFKWSDIPFNKLNKLTGEEKRAFLKKEEINIRQNLGEAVPTVIFRQIAQKIRLFLDKDNLPEQDIHTIIQNKNLIIQANLLAFIKKNHSLGFPLLSKISELANSKREANAAYYTRQDICFSIIKSLPEAKSYRELKILEPSIGVGNFLPVLISKYQSVSRVVIDVVDIDPYSIAVLKELVKTLNVPKNITINFIAADFLLYQFDKQYDIIIGNPPYGKITKDKALLKKYKAEAREIETNNIFAFFIEKSLRLGRLVSLIVPKSLISAPEFNKTRELLAGCRITKIFDFGEKGFKGVKIETVCFIVEPGKTPAFTEIESFITNCVEKKEQAYITDPVFPYWLIYRNGLFDSVAVRMRFGIFNAYRDRSITKAVTKTTKGKYRVLKSRNIGDNRIIDIEGYDSYMDDISNLDVSKFLNKTDCVLVPNLTYNPRASFLPPGCIVDGSVAILTVKDEKVTVTAKDLGFFGTEEYSDFYAIARNKGSRSLNIDNNSVFFFGILKGNKTMRDEIMSHLNQFDLDVRKSQDARFLDHKCTPDVVCFLADCVLNMISTKPVFVIKDIWESQYFIQNARVIFNKPWADDEKASNEYNKVLSQPLKLLAYARILNVEKIKNRLTFSVNNEDLLDYISRRDRNAYNFLFCYFTKVLSDSNFIRYIDEYRINWTKDLEQARTEIYDRYYRFISGNTPTQSKTDTTRMFHKILNIFALEYNIPGSSGEFAATFSGIMYNKKNWRDLNKEKGITRKEAAAGKEDQEQQQAYNQYYVEKATALIRKIHPESEVKDVWGNGDATQVHHIFPKSEFPQIAHYIENLIRLTPTQHNTKAHPKNKTNSVCKDYQLTCLLSKADSIEQSMRKDGEKYYRKESFIHVINTGLSLNLDTGLSFGDIKEHLIRIYNAT